MTICAAKQAGPAALAALLLSGCTIGTATASEAEVTANITRDQRINVVTTTGILADLVSNVAGERAQVRALVPEGADPHSYEPSLRDVRDIVYADLAFSNYLMLEEQSLIKALDANLKDGVPNIALAEHAVKYAADIIPLVEDVSLDTIWLGLRVLGDGAQYGAHRGSEVSLTAMGMTGPGDLVAYLTGSFGDVDIYFDSTDGFSRIPSSAEAASDTVTVPPDTHTHLSWAFTEPGYYTLDLRGTLRVHSEGPEIEIAHSQVTFAVGVNPHETPGKPGSPVLNAGHADIALDLDQHSFVFVADHEHGTADTHQQLFELDRVVIEVPGTALHQVPGDPAYRFLGRPGTQVYQLPQAVLGKHIHGEIDPHLWQNVRNAMSYVESIRDAFIDVDPAGSSYYAQRAAAYLRQLEALDDELREIIAEIPRARRTLVTTHDAYAYLARAYELDIVGFVTPNPATEPSLAERKRLTETVRNLRVPAVFLEPNLIARSQALTEIAQDQGIAVCPILGDAFSKEISSYVEMMRFNAYSLRRCLAETE